MEKYIMKKLIITAILCFIVSTAYGQIMIGGVDVVKQLKQLKQENTRLNIVIADVKQERNNLVIQIALLKSDANQQAAAMTKTLKILQQGVDSGKVDWDKLIKEVKWGLVLPETTKDKPKEKKK